MKRLDEILDHNRRYVETCEPVALPKQPQRQMAILTCIDTRLVAFLEQAIGIDRDDAVILKTAGASVAQGTRDVLRSLAASIFLLGVEEIIVVGHTDCGMGSVNVMNFADRMARWRVPREAFGSEDLRTWLGAFTDERQNVRETVAAIRRAEVIPNNVPVHGLLLDVRTGALEVIARDEVESQASAQTQESTALAPSDIPVADLLPPAPADPIGRG